MMQSHETFYAIEQEETVEEIRINHVQLWPIIRLKFFEELRKHEGVTSRVMRLNPSVIKTLIKSLFLGFPNLFRLRKKEYWIFSASDRRKLLGDLYYDRVADAIPDILPATITFENPFPLGKHYARKDMPHKQVISQSMFYLGSFLFALFCRKYKMEKEHLIRELLEKYKVSINYRKEYATFMGQYYFTLFILRFCKPKVIFMVYTASSMGYISAFKRKKIPVVELQHGVINDRHVAYNVRKPFDTGFFPDLLFTYGNMELNYFGEENHFIPLAHVIPIGYYFLEAVVQTPAAGAGLQRQLKAQYQSIVVFSFQEPMAAWSLPFLIRAAMASPDYVYLIIPRNPAYNFDSWSFPPNVRVERDLNIYEAMKIGDIHTTINSTTALEAFCFGIPSVLMDINHMAGSYYKNLFDNVRSVTFAIDTAGFIKEITAAKDQDKAHIRNEGNRFFKQDYATNFRQALQRIDMLSSYPANKSLATSK